MWSGVKAFEEVKLECDLKKNVAIEKVNLGDHFVCRVRDRLCFSFAGLTFYL